MAQEKFLVLLFGHLLFSYPKKLLSLETISIHLKKNNKKKLTVLEEIFGFTESSLFISTLNDHLFISWFLITFFIYWIPKKKVVWATSATWSANHYNRNSPTFPSLPMNYYYPSLFDPNGLLVLKLPVHPFFTAVVRLTSS